MFIENKYSKWYYNIITNAKSRPSPRPNETHHVLPKCLNGNNDKSNLVDLSIREHYICHLLLTKFTVGIAKKKMFYALHRLTNTSDTKIKSSRIYMYIRLNHSLIVSQKMKENNPNKNGRKPTAKQSISIRKANSERIWTEESKLKMSRSQKLRRQNKPESFNIGVPKSKEHKENLSKSRLNKFQNSDKEIFNWFHPLLGKFIGTRSELRNTFSNEQLKVSELSKVINPKYAEKSYKGWRVS